MILFNINRFILCFDDAHQTLYLAEGIFFCFILVNLGQLLQQKIHFIHPFLNQFIHFLFKTRTYRSKYLSTSTSDNPMEKIFRSEVMHINYLCGIQTRRSRCSYFSRSFACTRGGSCQSHHQGGHHRRTTFNIIQILLYENQRPIFSFSISFFLSFFKFYSLRSNSFLFSLLSLRSRLTLSSFSYCSFNLLNSSNSSLSFIISFSLFFFFLSSSLHLSSVLFFSISNSSTYCFNFYILSVLEPFSLIATRSYCYIVVKSFRSRLFSSNNLPFYYFINSVVSFIPISLPYSSSINFFRFKN